MNKNFPIDISIIIPVYNSGKNLELLIDEVEQVLSNNKNTYELILIDDCSTDNSWSIIQNICNKSKFVKGLLLRKNVGQHNAIFAGLKYSSGKYVLTMDDDGQNSPNDIISLIEEIKKGYDVVYANYLQKEHNIFRKIGSSLNNIVSSFLFKKPLNLKLTSFRCFKHEIKDEIIKSRSSSIYLDGLIFYSTSCISNILVQHKKREFGKSNYTFRKLFGLWLQMATGFSILPLRVASFFGIFFSLSSFLITIWFVFIREIPLNVPMGWTSLVVIAFFFGGIQLLALGLIGEYIGRTYLNTNRTLQYSEKEKLNF